MTAGIMVDAHCHILPYMDDGATDLDESVAMARVAAEDGIRKIIATPHIRDRSCSPEQILENVEAVNQQLQKKDIPVKIYPAAEISIGLDLPLFRQYTINHTPYILIELPFDHLPFFMNKLFAWIRSEGLWPIIAHPERNLGVMRNPAAFMDKLLPGIYVQITAGSLTGDFGAEVQSCAELLLDSGKVDIIASDAHSRKARPPILSKGFEIASRRIGRPTAWRLVNGNPEKILAGMKID
jgi:protein-tyrosine phosphatase